MTTEQVIVSDILEAEELSDKAYKQAYKQAYEEMKEVPHPTTLDECLIYQSTFAGKINKYFYEILNKGPEQ